MKNVKEYFEYFFKYGVQEARHGGAIKKYHQSLIHNIFMKFNNGFLIFNSAFLSFLHKLFKFQYSSKAKCSSQTLVCLLYTSPSPRD